MEWGLLHRQLGPIRATGVDEIAYGQGATKSLTLVYQIEAGCTRLVVGRSRSAHQGGLPASSSTLIGPELSQGIEFVCSDMWQPYLDLIKLNCPKALNILDRFHVVSKLNTALDEMRTARRIARRGYEPILKKSRWCLLKRPKNLTTNQRVKLREVLRYNLKSVRAYLLKEYFQLFWEYRSPAWAGKFLDRWCQEVMRWRIRPLKKFARTVRNHRELLLNYFRARKAYSSGVIEGLNNKAKVTMRKAYGFRTFKATELALYVLGKLPEPPLAHSFY